MPSGELPAGAVRRADHRAHPAGRGHRRQQRARHPAGRAAITAQGPRRRGADATSTGCTPPRTAPTDVPRSAPTSTPPAPTSGPARTSARSIAAPALLERLRPDKLASAPDRVPDRFETGTLPFADLAGVTAAVDHLAGLDPQPTGPRRRRACSPRWPRSRPTSRPSSPTCCERLAALPHVHLYRLPGPPYRHRLLHRRRPQPAPGRRAPGRAQGQRVGRALLRLGGDRRVRHPRRRLAPCGRAWCTTTTAPTSTACSPPSRSSPPEPGGAGPVRRGGAACAAPRAGRGGHRSPCRPPSPRPGRVPGRRRTGPVRRADGAGRGTDDAGRAGRLRGRTRRRGEPGDPMPYAARAPRPPSGGPGAHRGG